MDLHLPTVQVGLIGIVINNRMHGASGVRRVHRRFQMGKRLFHQPRNGDSGAEAFPFDLPENEKQSRIMSKPETGKSWQELFEKDREYSEVYL